MCSLPMNPSEYPVYIIGGGKVGATLAFHLASRSYPIVAVVQHHPTKHPHLHQLLPNIPVQEDISRASLRSARVIIIAVQDDRLPHTINTIIHSGGSFAGKVIIHTSGVYTAAILNPFQQQGGYTASAHPNVALSAPDTSKNPFRNIYFDIEGDDQAFQICRKMFSHLGAKVLRISAEQKVSMHLAAVVYSNFLVVLADIAQSILKHSGFSDQYLFSPFEPLLVSTLQNLETSPPGEALTGPVQRGDVETIRSHLMFLRKHLPEQLQSYLVLTEQAIRMSSLPASVRSKIMSLLHEYRND